MDLSRENDAGRCLLHYDAPGLPRLSSGWHWNAQEGRWRRGHRWVMELCEDCRKRLDELDALAEQGKSPV